MLYGYLFFVILTRPLRVGAKVYSEEQATETRAEEKSVEQALRVRQQLRVWITFICKERLRIFIIGVGKM